MLHPKDDPRWQLALATRLMRLIGIMLWVIATITVLPILVMLRMGGHFSPLSWQFALEILVPLAPATSLIFLSVLLGRTRSRAAVTWALVTAALTLLLGVLATAALVLRAWSLHVPQLLVPALIML